MLEQPEAESLAAKLLSGRGLDYMVILVSCAGLQVGAFVLSNNVLLVGGTEVA